MARESKDTPEVATFRTLFARLREWMDDEPEAVINAAKHDDSIDALCGRLDFAASALKRAERSRPELFSAPTDPAFIREWRDFENRYEQVVGHVARRWLSDLLDLPDRGLQQAPGVRERWEIADGVADNSARGFEGALDFAADQISQADRFEDEFADSIEDGLREWEQLKTEVGFDLRGVVRRRQLVPFTLLPRHVSDRYGTGDRASLLTNLRAAHDAFVFGSPLAALAMMRAILEAVLRDHYDPPIQDLKLEERINRVQRLPVGAPRAALHRIRRLGNVVLHTSEDGGRVLPAPDAAETETTIVGLLVVLRTLIEEAPKAPGGPSRAAPRR